MLSAEINVHNYEGRIVTTSRISGKLIRWHPEGKLARLLRPTCRLMFWMVLMGNWPQSAKRRIWTAFGITNTQAHAQFVTDHDKYMRYDGVSKYLREFHAEFMTVHQRQHRCKHFAVHPSFAKIEQYSRVFTRGTAECWIV